MTEKRQKPKRLDPMLPTKPTKPTNAMDSMSMLLYGPSKIGKSTFCSSAPGAVFLATEPGLNHLEVFQTAINDWDDFRLACRELGAGEHQFKTIIVDTVDNLHQMCHESVCKQLNIKHPSDLGYGKGWAAINTSFQSAITYLAKLPYGLILISHSKEKELETAAGKQTRTVPTVPEGCRKFLTGLVDLILYCDLDGGADGVEPARVIRTKPARDYDAGDRTGNLPDTIPLDYDIFAAALSGDSRQTDPDFDELQALAAELWADNAQAELDEAIIYAGFSPSKLSPAEVSTMIDILTGLIEDQNK